MLVSVFVFQTGAPSERYERERVREDDELGEEGEDYTFVLTSILHHLALDVWSEADHCMSGQKEIWGEKR